MRVGQPLDSNLLAARDPAFPMPPGLHGAVRRADLISSRKPSHFVYFPRPASSWVPLQRRGELMQITAVYNDSAVQPIILITLTLGSQLKEPIIAEIYLMS